MVLLGVNIDHVATVRQARRGWEPDPCRAAVEAEMGGADGITVHLREDRRHIQDHDLRRLRDVVRTGINLEMAATEEMVGIAIDLSPQIVMLVPEGRMEVTTEGGLDVVANQRTLVEVVKRLHQADMKVSAFIDAEIRQIDAAAACGFDVCEVHTGPFAHAFHQAGENPASSQVRTALDEIQAAGRAIVEHGMGFNAGHALNYRNVALVAGLEGLAELHIGHSIVSRAIFSGFRQAVADMKGLIDGASELDCDTLERTT